MIHDDLGRHLAAAGAIDRAAVPLGMYLAWCTNLQLISDELAGEHGRLVLRVRYREITGAELLVGACAGELADRHLNDEGRRFTAFYLPRYLDDFRTTFGTDPYAVPDDWVHYDLIAPLLTRELMAFRKNHSAGGSKVIGRTDQRWWRRGR